MRFAGHILLPLVAVGFAELQLWAQAELSTTNRAQLQHFWQAMDRSNGPVTVLAFGDSVSESFRSIQMNVFDRLQSTFGVAGYTIENGHNHMLWQTGNGTVRLPISDEWWTDEGWLPAGGYVFWTNQVSATGSLLCDRVGVFWIARPGGGSFTLSVSTNGGPWSAPLAALDGASPTSKGRYQAVPLAKGYYRLRVDGVSGTNLIVGPQYLDSTSTGINVANMYQGGVNLNQIFSFGTNVLYPLLSAINPQLVIWHMKEVADIGATDFSNRLYDLEALWRACVTNGDIVYIGTPYEARDLTESFTPIQNTLVRQAAIRDGHVYLDCMNPCVSYQYMTNHGYLLDSVHPSDLCNSFLAEIVRQQLGLFALRVDRRLSLEPLATGVRLTWPTTTGLGYDLQSSTNLADWMTLATVVGNGQTSTFTNASPVSQSLFFRLSVTGD